MNNITTLYIYYIKGKFKGNINKDTYLGCWFEEGDSFLFFSKNEDKEIKSIIKSQKDLILKDSFEMDYFEWIGGRFDSFYVGDVKIIPVWEKDSKIGEKDILLDPGVVFGAGNHETTYNCLLAINFLFSNKSPINRVLDIGCGTGILSLFCGKLGAREVFAIDLNPLAVKTTRKNVLLNKLDDKILPIWGRGEDFLDLKGELLVANIHYDVLSQIVNVINTNNFKWLVLSGIFPSRAREIESFLNLKGFKTIKIFGENSSWPAIVGGVL